MTNSIEYLRELGFVSLSPCINPLEIPKGENEISLHDFYIAGFRYYDGLKELNNLKEGDELILVPEKDNIFDPQAVSVFTGSGNKLGYIPEMSNIVSYNLFESGMEIKCIIQKIDKDANPREMIYCSIYQLI